jgi:hypothetical protein
VTVPRWIPDELADRARRVLLPWAGATPDERRRAILILREHERQRVNERVRRSHVERLVEEDPLYAATDVAVTIASGSSVSESTTNVP